MIPAAAGAAALVAVLAWVRSRRGVRWPVAAADVGVVLFPIATAFLVWAITGWIINDEFFATLSSQYGNASQVAGRLAAGTGDADAQWPVIAARLFGMQPLTGLAVAAAVVIAATRRRAEPIVPVVVFGATLAFAAVAQHHSMTFGWFRFYLVAIPMVICVGLACWREQPASRVVAAALVSASIVVAVPVTTPLIVDQDIAYGQLEAGFVSLVDPAGHPPGEDPARRRLISERRLAQWFDEKNLPDGTVLMDSFLTWGIWLSSERPKQFVITSDYDFVAALNRPWDFGIRYIVVTDPGHNVPDAINRRYPTMWSDGAGVGAWAYSWPTGRRPMRCSGCTARSGGPRRRLRPSSAKPEAETSARGHVDRDAQRGQQPTVVGSRHGHRTHRHRRAVLDQDVVDPDERQPVSACGVRTRQTGPGGGRHPGIRRRATAGTVPCQRSR